MPDTTALDQNLERRQRQLEQLDRLAQRFGTSLSTAFAKNAADGRRLDDVLNSVGHTLLNASLRAAMKPLRSGLTALFENLRDRKVGLVSLRDGLDLETPSGRLMANVLASVAAYENEVRSERIVAGQQVARSNGKRWGGSKPGKRRTVTTEQIKVILRLKAEGTAIAAIARIVRVSRPTVYGVLDSV